MIQEYPTLFSPNVIVVQPEIFTDNRGWSTTSFRADTLTMIGATVPFVYDLHSHSVQGVVRGLHYQVNKVQTRIVRVVSGEIFDVVVDLRKDSPTFGKWCSVILSAKNKKQIWISHAFAHGYYVLSKQADVVYKFTDYRFPECERVIMWNDPTLKIEWPLLNEQPPILSERDSKGKSFLESDTF